MAKIFLCDTCKHFTDKCEHKNNVYIELSRRIEKKKYISLEKVRRCENYEEI